MNTLIPTAITTGAKALGNSALTVFVKANQAYEGYSNDKFRQVFSNSKAQLRNEYMDIMGSCTGQQSMVNTPEKTIIKNLMCKIIANKNSNQQNLSDETLSELSSIINVYSGNKYISMTKKMYDDEKKAASDAIMNGIIGTQLVNTTIDVGSAVIKSSYPTSTVGSLLNIQPPTPSTTKDIAIGALEKASLPAATALGSYYLGKEVLKTYNKSIPKKYIPDFNLLITALTERKKKKEQVTKEFNICYNDLLKEMYLKINKYFTDNPTINVYEFYYNTQNLTDKINILRRDFNFQNQSLKPNASGFDILKGFANSQCEKIRKASVSSIDDEIKIITEIMKQFTSLFNITSEDHIKLINVTDELVPILSNIKLETIDLSTLRTNINHKIDEINDTKRKIEESKPKKSIMDEATNWLLPGRGGNKTIKRGREKRRKTYKKHR